MDYAKTLIDAQEKLKQLSVQRDALDREIEALLHIIEGAQIATKDPSYWDPDNPGWVPKKSPDSEPIGVTDGIRKILYRSGEAMLPTEIRDALVAMGIEGSSRKNLLIHVHKALGRMHDSDELAQVPRDGKMAYRLMTMMDRHVRILNETTRAARDAAVAAVGGMTPPPSLGGGLKIPR